MCDKLVIYKEGKLYRTDTYGNYVIFIAPDSYSWYDRRHRVTPNDSFTYSTSCREHVLNKSSVKCIREPLCAIIQNFTMFIQQQLTNTNGPATKRIMFSSVQLNNPEAMMNKLVERFTAVLLIIQPPQVRI